MTDYELLIKRYKMKKDNLIQNESYKFAVEIIKLYQYLVKEKNEFVLSKQILRCGTSIGANVEEAIGGQSGKDFYSKMTIAYKEARETHYWIRLLYDTGYINKDKMTSLIDDVEKILKIIGSIQKTMKQKLNS